MLDEVEDEDVEGVVVPNKMIVVVGGGLVELDGLVREDEEEVVLLEDQFDWVDEDEVRLVALDDVVDTDVEGIEVLEYVVDENV